jgi:Rod binding domain-containing protein
MNVNPIAQTTNTSGAGALPRTGQAGFNSFLTKASDQVENRGLSQQQKLRRASDQLVSSALLKPLFKQMRSSPFKVERFHGGQGEKAFMQQLHTVLADRISQSANFGLGDAIYEKMARQLPGVDQQHGTQVNTHG